MSEQAFLAFSLGPVQSFIGAARTVRDLWTGSYLLSWLTFRALEVVARDQGPEALVFPDISKHPLWLRGQGRHPPAKDLLEPCLPNRFLAEVSADKAGQLAEDCRQACEDEWKKICDSVRQVLAQRKPHRSLEAGGLWQAQVGSFFEMVTVVLPQAECTPEKLSALLKPGEAGSDWARRWQVAGKLLQAARSVRHFPAYAPTFSDGRVPQKCSLLGSFEHLGPGEREESRVWWEAAAEAWRYRGTRTGPRERLCAVSLVKRFAWPLYFHETLRIPLSEMRFEDTATAAAALWLREEPALSPEQVREDHEDWSGQWLHWQTREQDADERPVPDDTWKVILDKRRRQGYPSAYYAVLMLDADRMGDRLLAARDPEDHRRTSRTLATFALHKVRPIVEDRHFGQLIYAGGDDVLAVLPTRTALACARDLNKEFHDNWRLDAKNGQPLTLSAGLAVAHYKEDLRFVLGEAHAAEKQAKTLGRNALFVRVCRRSGEHSGALCPWGFVEQLIAWEEAFRKGASDRWAYHLKRDLETLQGLDAPAVDALVRRQVGRAEERTSRLLGGPEGVEGALHLYRELDATREPPRPESDRIADFVTLCQTASFLAREKEG